MKKSRRPDWGPDDDSEEDQPPRMTQPAAAKDPDFVRTHDYVSSACAHRKHTLCDEVCKYCSATCVCVCHRWAVEL